MGHNSRFIRKMKEGGYCLGTAITFSDAAITEALSPALDFAWIDMEHSPLSLETVQTHILALKGTACTSLVRVPWNDPVLVKPVLDLGAEGVILPMVRTAQEAQKAVEACLYPPQGIRGFGPRRPCNYGRTGGPEWCREANESVIVIPQLEHIDAARNIDEILRVPGISAIAIGPQDLSGSMGLLGQVKHPDVVAAIDAMIEKANRANIPAGVAGLGTYEDVMRFVAKGARWVAVAADFIFLTRAVDEFFGKLRRGRTESREAS